MYIKMSMKSRRDTVQPQSHFTEHAQHILVMYDYIYATKMTLDLEPSKRIGIHEVSMSSSGGRTNIP